MQRRNQLGHLFGCSAIAEETGLVAVDRAIGALEWEGCGLLGGGRE